MSKSPLRRRITPTVPYILKVETEEGTCDITFQLAYDLNALSLFEEVTGVSLLTDMDVIIDKPTVSNVTALFWAAVQEHNPEYVGFEGLAALRHDVTIDKLADIRSACIDAFIAQLPKEKAKTLKEKLDAIRKGETPSPLAPQPPSESTANQ